VLERVNMETLVQIIKTGRQFGVSFRDIAFISKRNSSVFRYIHEFRNFVDGNSM
jgi:hypothetical protein